MLGQELSIFGCNVAYITLSQSSRNYKDARLCTLAWDEPPASRQRDIEDGSILILVEEMCFQSDMPIENSDGMRPSKRNAQLLCPVGLHVEMLRPMDSLLLASSDQPPVIVPLRKLELIPLHLHPEATYCAPPR